MAMSQTERLYKLKSLLDSGQCLSKARLPRPVGLVEVVAEKLRAGVEKTFWRLTP
jgi:hypothetical protein